jgi:CubicO group peptidase (beta-lactamase class C family)
MNIQRMISKITGQHAEYDVNTLAEAYFKLGKMNGSVLVTKGDRVLLKKGFGWANVEEKIPVTPQTVFRIGSITKSFTAVLIMQLVEQGKIALADTLAKFMPDFPNAGRITVHHLLSNTSGLFDLLLVPRYEQIMDQPQSLEDLIALFRDESLLFEPGAEFGYSNSNWILLGHIIEQVTGKSFGDALKDTLFAPLGMTQSGVDWSAKVKNRAVGYATSGDQWERARSIDSSAMHGAGAIHMNVEDFYRWSKALFGGKLLRPETIQRMTTSVFEGYGYGWEVQTLHRHTVVGHSGGLDGFLSNYIYVPDADLTVIVMNNVGSAAWKELSEGLVAAALGEPFEMPTSRTFVQVDSAIFSAYVGEYDVSFMGRTFRLTFSVQNDKLVMAVAGLSNAVLSPMSEVMFFGRSKGEVEMTFECGENGLAESIDMLWGGYRSTAKRVA